MKAFIVGTLWSGALAIRESLSAAPSDFARGGDTEQSDLVGEHFSNGEKPAEN